MEVYPLRNPQRIARTIHLFIKIILSRVFSNLFHNFHPIFIWIGTKLIMPAIVRWYLWPLFKVVTV